MACIHDKFATSTGKRNISSKQIWEHLQELYNLQALVSIWSLKILLILFVFGESRKDFTGHGNRYIRHLLKCFHNFVLIASFARKYFEIENIYGLKINRMPFLCSLSTYLLRSS